MLERLLPPANKVWGKLIFSQACVIPSVLSSVHGKGAVAVRWLPSRHHRSYDWGGGGVCIQGEGGEGVCIQGEGAASRITNDSSYDIDAINTFSSYDIYVGVSHICFKSL